MKTSIDSILDERRGERGSARTRFIIIFAVVVILGYMAVQYVPVAYRAYTLRRSMDDTVEKAANGSMPAELKGQWVEDQLKASANDYGVPSNARIVPLYQNGRVEVTVQFKRPINLLPGLWTYDYPFDYTAKSSTFLNAR
jgi:hypothetical protein